MTKPDNPPAKKTDCQHCRNGWFHDQRFGQDVECVNGVLIDIDVAHEGYPLDVIFPVAPCHPKWSAQKRGREFRNDSQERLAAWAAGADSEPDAMLAERTKPNG